MPPTTTTPLGCASLAIHAPHSRSTRVETALHGVSAASTAVSAGPVSVGGRTTRGSAAVVSANGHATSMPMRPVDSAGARPWRRRGQENRSSSSVGTGTDNSCSLPTSVASRWCRLGVTNLVHHDDRGGFTSCACSTRPSGRGCPFTGLVTHRIRCSPSFSTPPVSTTPSNTGGARPPPNGPAGRCGRCSACFNTVPVRCRRAR